MPFDDDNPSFTSGSRYNGSPITPPIDYLAQLAGLVDTRYAFNSTLRSQPIRRDAEPAAAIADAPEYAPRSLLGTVQKLGLEADDDTDPLRAYRDTAYTVSRAVADFLDGQNAYSQSSPDSNRVDDWARQPGQAMFADEPAFAYAYAANQKARQESEVSQAPSNPDQTLSGDTIMDRPVEYMSDKALQFSLSAGSDRVKQVAAQEIARREQTEAPNSAIAELDSAVSDQTHDMSDGNNGVAELPPNTTGSISTDAPLHDSEPEYIKAYASGWQPSGTSARAGDGWIRQGKRLDADPAALAVANADDGSLDLQRGDYASRDGTKTVSETGKAVVRQIWQDQAFVAQHKEQDQSSSTANKPLLDRIGKQYTYLSEGLAKLEAGEGNSIARSQAAQAARDLYGAEVTRLIQSQKLSAQDAQVIQAWEQALNDKMRAFQISSPGSDHERGVYAGERPISHTNPRGLENHGKGQQDAPPAYIPYPTEPGMEPVITPVTLLPALRLRFLQNPDTGWDFPIARQEEADVGGHFWHDEIV